MVPRAHSTRAQSGHLLFVLLRGRWRRSSVDPLASGQRVGGRLGPELWLWCAALDWLSTGGARSFCRPQRRSEATARFLIDCICGRLIESAAERSARKPRAPTPGCGGGGRARAESGRLAPRAHLQLRNVWLCILFHSSAFITASSMGQVSTQNYSCALRVLAAKNDYSVLYT